MADFMRASAAALSWMLILGMMACEQRPANEITGNEVKNPAAAPVPRVAPGAAPTAAPKKEEDGREKLFARMWQMTRAPHKPPRGSLWVFLKNGTLLETSCVETYRVAKWSLDEKDPRLLQVIEDHQPAFTAEILEVTDQGLRLRQKLTRQNEEQELGFTGVDGEIVCPDLR